MQDTTHIHKFILSLAMIAVMFCACKRQLDKEAYVEYINDPKNGLIKEKNVNHVQMKLWYKPTGFLVEQHIGNNKPTPGLIDSLRKHYAQYMYFVLSMSKNNQEILNHLAADRARFGAMVNQLAFGMGEKVTLVQNHEDTLQLADYHYARMYGVGTSTDILFAFKKGKLEKNGELVFYLQDFGLLTGNTKYKFRNKDIINIPELKFKN